MVHLCNLPNIRKSSLRQKVSFKNCLIKPCERLKVELSNNRTEFKLCKLRISSVFLHLKRFCLLISTGCSTFKCCNSARENINNPILFHRKKTWPFSEEKGHFCFHAMEPLNYTFSQKSKGGTKGKFSKMADFLVELRKGKKIGNTSRLMA